MLKQHKLLLTTLALTICAGVFLFPLTAYAEEEGVVIAVETDLDAVDQTIITEEDTTITGEDAAPKKMRIPKKKPSRESRHTAGRATLRRTVPAR